MSLLQSELATTHDAHAGEIGQLSADRDALAKQCAEQRAQCEALSFELGALRQQLTEAMEGERPCNKHYLKQSIRWRPRLPACREGTQENLCLLRVAVAPRNAPANCDLSCSQHKCFPFWRHVFLLYGAIAALHTCLRAQVA